MPYIINTLNTDWDEPPRARRQVAEALSKFEKVIFISKTKFGFFTFSKRNINKNLLIYTPHFPIGDRIRHRIVLLNEFYQHWVFRYMSNRFPNSRLINFDHTATRLSLYFNNYIYFCNDNHASIPFDFYPRHCEKIMSKKALFCIATSITLKNKLLKFNNNSFEEHLGSPEIPTTIIPKFQLNINRKIKVGMVGFIKGKDIPINLIKKIAENEKVNLTIIGPVSKKYKKELILVDGLILEGPLVYNSLYNKVSEFDVCIAPYIMRNKNLRTPNKMGLYLAFGKPMVVSEIHEIRNWDIGEKLIYRSLNDDDFLSNIFKAHKENNKELFLKRIEYSKKNSWEKKIKTIIALYDKYESKKN